MIKRRCWQIVLLLAVGLCRQAIAEIVITVPQEPIPVGQYSQLDVTGLEDQFLPSAQITCEPREGVLLIPAKSWAGAPFLIFSASKPGQYRLTIHVNAWAGDLETVIDQAEQAKVMPEILDQLQRVEAEIASRYPYRLGEAVVEVRNPGPPPPPPPPPDPPPGPRQVTIIYESEDGSPPLLLLLRKVQAYCKEAGHQYYAVDDDAVGPDGRPPQWLTALKQLMGGQGVAIPAIAVSCEYLGQQWFRIKPLPATGEAALQIIQEAGG